MKTYNETYNEFSLSVNAWKREWTSKIQDMITESENLISWTDEFSDRLPEPLRISVKRKKEYIEEIVDMLEELMHTMKEDSHLLDQHNLELISKIYHLRDNGYEKAKVITTSGEIWHMNLKNPTWDSMTELHESGEVWIFKREESMGIYISLSDIADIEGVKP